MPSPALSGSQKGLSSVWWEGMTVEDFGSECLCGNAAFLPVCVFINVSVDVSASQCTCLRLHVVTCMYAVKL